MLCNWNEKNLNRFPRINWRASLVPAAAVIPAPIAYIKVVAVETLVVGFLLGQVGRSKWLVLTSFLTFSRGMRSHFIVCLWNRDVYFEEMRVLQAGLCHEYVSMEYYHWTSVHGCWLLEPR